MEFSKFIKLTYIQQILALGPLAGYLAAEQNQNGKLFFLTASALVSNELLAIGKIDEYNKIINALEEYGWSARLIEPKSHSYCQRKIAQAASDDAGYGNETRNYLNEKGYKWYHFFPDVSRHIRP